MHSLAKQDINLCHRVHLILGGFFMTVHICFIKLRLYLVVSASTKALTLQCVFWACYIYNADVQIWRN
jgi:hypothetical protein